MTTGDSKSDFKGSGGASVTYHIISNYYSNFLIMLKNRFTLGTILVKDILLITIFAVFNSTKCIFQCLARG